MSECVPGAASVMFGKLIGSGLDGTDRGLSRQQRSAGRGGMGLRSIGTGVMTARPGCRRGRIACRWDHLEAEDCAASWP
jgi:hypothetical protein